MFTRLTLISLLLAGCAPIINASTLVWDAIEAHIDMEPDQEQARAVFTVTNEGEKTVRIARIKTSCGCTGSILDKKIIEPGESTEVVATFNKGKRQGLNRNRLQVYLDSEPEPVVTLLMNVQIPTLIEAKPQIVYWSASSSKSERRVRITLDKHYIDEITGIDFDRSQLKVSEEPGDLDEGIAKVLVIEPLDYTQLYRGTITIHGNGPGGRTAETRLHAFIQP
ncbi:DUF1573 domain-containing protein [Coraliomargarita sp. SDUM461004]|uniref:DUF1573 domain-containing protein n=1 Tax=Thalassobacterium sedimentorum TaxID=3041258 RepID=A0ABU1AMX9_9BACT|nr:DUF1573 domain-containing protein [Coraliomargarita sp. SDUM461004]MDQ8196149.1 DUF1573 domain-containing protein [Coraliomargarita sp. SDUM461004]